MILKSKVRRMISSFGALLGNLVVLLFGALDASSFIGTFLELCLCKLGFALLGLTIAANRHVGRNKFDGQGRIDYVLARL